MKRPLLLPFNPLYAATTATRNLLYDRETLPSRALPFPVVSVGNLSTGGTGKTPLVLAISQLLSAASRYPVILSRGYGRASSDIAQVDPAGTTAQFGDEPLLLARNSPAPVFVGADRYAAGVFAGQSLALPPTTIFLLDDGFQHRQLSRDANVVLISRSDLDDSLLPAGNLREPLSSLTRADILVFNEPDAELAPKFLGRFIHPSCSRPVLWTVRRSLDISSLPTTGARPVAFAGIAHPAEFFSSLRAHGFDPITALAFRDHHRYAAADIARIEQAATAANANLILTTEKDLVRLDVSARSQLNGAAPLHAVPLGTEILRAETCLAQILALCNAKSPTPA